jgi:two-component system LytT family response regulator
MIRTVIVDDERLARQKVRALLAHDADIDIIRECANAADAIDAVKSEHPDLLLLDVEMPGENGFDVLRRLRGERMPVVIFITAHDEYAVRAFEVEAVDYLLKPFDRKRFDEAMRRAKKLLQSDRDEIEARLLRVLESLAPSKRLDHFVVKSRDRAFFIAVSDTDYIEAEGKYVRVHSSAGAHLVRESIGEVEERLDARKFLRIHRGTIVNVKRIAEIHRGFGGNLFVILRDGTRLTMSRRYRARIREVTGMDV